MYSLYLHPLFYSGWLVTFSNWLQNTSFILNVASSDWSYPFVQMTHFTGLSLWVGTSIALDLRLMGYGKGKTPAQLLDTLFAWNWAGLIIAILGGVTLFGVGAGGYIANPAFELKLGFLVPVGIILHIIIQAKTKTWGQTLNPPPIAKFAGLIELLWWFCAASAAVAIPYF